MPEIQYLFLVSYKHHWSKNRDLLQILYAYFIQISCISDKLYSDLTNYQFCIYKRFLFVSDPYILEDMKLFRHLHLRFGYEITQQTFYVT